MQYIDFATRVLVSLCKIKERKKTQKEKKNKHALIADVYLCKNNILKNAQKYSTVTMEYVFT